MTDSTVSPSYNTPGCCVIIPTYNNINTLEKVILGVLEHTDRIIIVNDGSTDGTRKIIQKFPKVTSLHYERNQGKGFAIRQGFKEARKKGFTHAITIDSDGQHLPSDIPIFFEKLRTDPGTLIIGARNMEQAGIPGGSTFGNRFSNFWTWVETGYRLPDTQSGYRLYPLEKMADMVFFTNRFEFEIEVLVRAAWKGIPLDSVPVSVIYPPKTERVSHFRPFTDFTRISILNTFLVILAMMFFRPWMIIRDMMKDGFQEMVRTQLFNPDESNFKKSASLALGIFMGIMPIWGWQMVVALTLAIFLKLNKAITLIASNISIPPLMPLILFGSYMTGGLVLNNRHDVNYDSGITFEFVKNNLLQYIVGSVVLGLALGILAGLTTWIILSIFRRK